MLSLIILACSLSVIVSAGPNECYGKKDNYRFIQECNECWCQNGKPLCTNKGCTVRRLVKNVSLGTMECVGKKDNFQFFQDCNECWCRNGIATCTNKGCVTFVSRASAVDDNDDDDNGEHRRENAIGTHAWDLDNKFPKDREEGESEDPVTPYPKSFRYKFNLQQPVLAKVQKYPPHLAFNHPDAGGLNVLHDTEIAGHGHQYPYYYSPMPYPGYADFSNYRQSPNYLSSIFNLLGTRKIR